MLLFTVPGIAVITRTDFSDAAECFWDAIGTRLLWKFGAMRYLNWIDQLSPVAPLPALAVLFLIASILGWYVGSLIQWLRR